MDRLALGRGRATASLALGEEDLVLALAGRFAHKCTVGWLTGALGLEDALGLGATVGGLWGSRASLGIGARWGAESAIDTLDLDGLFVRCTWRCLVVLSG